MKMFRKEEGFTLIELMVVVLIIGILVAIAIPVFGAARDNAQKRSCYANERTLEGAAHSYEASVGSMPGSGISALYTALVGPTKYIATGPACPLDATKSMTASYSWDGSVTNCIVSGSTHGHY